MATLHEDKISSSELDPDTGCYFFWMKSGLFFKKDLVTTCPGMPNYQQHSEIHNNRFPLPRKEQRGF